MYGPNIYTECDQEMLCFTVLSIQIEDVQRLPSPKMRPSKAGRQSNCKGRVVAVEVRGQQGMGSAMVGATRSIEAQTVEGPDSLFSLRAFTCAAPKDQRWGMCRSET